MNKDILISVPLVDQFKDTEDVKWKRCACGICAVKMLMSFKKSRISSVPVMKLIKKAVLMGGYIKDIGWSHRSLVELASQYGIKLSFQKKFPKTRADKVRKLMFVDRSIERGKPVVISVHHFFRSSNGGHLVVVNGLREKGVNIIGYHIQDPDKRFKGNNYFVTKAQLLKGWRGGLIYLA